MNCIRIRERLSSFVGGCLSDDELPAIEAHLSECEACRKERDALRAVLGLMTAEPTPTVHVNVAHLYREQSNRIARRARRWRRLALATGALAAGVLLLILVPRMELRFEDAQVVLRWGEPPPAPVVEPPPPPVVPPPDDRDERIERLTRLIHALAQDVQERDLNRQRELGRLQGSVETLLADTIRQRLVSAQDSDILTRLLEDLLRRKGENP